MNIFLVTFINVMTYGCIHSIHEIIHFPLYEFRMRSYYTSYLIQKQRGGFNYIYGMYIMLGAHALRFV